MKRLVFKVPDHIDVPEMVIEEIKDKLRELEGGCHLSFIKNNMPLWLKRHVVPVKTFRDAYFSHCTDWKTQPLTPREICDVIDKYCQENEIGFIRAKTIGGSSCRIFESYAENRIREQLFAKNYTGV